MIDLNIFIVVLLSESHSVDDLNTGVVFSGCQPKNSVAFWELSTFALVLVLWKRIR